MEIIIKTILFHSNEDIESFQIKVNESNYLLIIKKLQSERNKIINYLEDLKEKGIIKSSRRPKIHSKSFISGFPNKKTQENLDHICEVKRQINKSIDKLKTIYQ